MTVTTTAPAVPAWITAAEFTAERVAHLTRLTAAGGGTAHTVLAAHRAAGILADAYRQTVERMGRSGDDSRPAFADNVARLVADAVALSQHIDPYAPAYARNAVVYAYRGNGLAGVLAEVNRRGETASYVAVSLDRVTTA